MLRQEFRYWHAASGAFVIANCSNKNTLIGPQTRIHKDLLEWIRENFDVSVIALVR
jgi:hypothetical protein